MRTAIIALVLALLSTSSSHAQVPNEFYGVWSTDGQSCDPYIRDGIMVFDISDYEIAWGDMVCSAKGIDHATAGARLEASCAKANAAVAGAIALRRIKPGLISISWEIGTDRVGGTEVAWLCPARYQREAVAQPSVSAPDKDVGESRWQYEDSIAVLKADEHKRTFVLDRVGSTSNAEAGDVLFDGILIGSDYAGTAYAFDKKCGSFPYPVRGPIAPTGTRVSLHGKSPRIDQACRVVGYEDVALDFSVLADRQ